MGATWIADGEEKRLAGFILPIGLTLDEAVVSGRDTQVGTDPFFIHLGKDASARVRVSSESIANFLGSLDLGGLRDVAVTTSDGLLVVSATAVVLIPIRATIRCSLSLRDSKRVDIVLETAEPGAAFGLVQRKLAEVNPVLDLSGLDTNVALTSVTVEESGVVLIGGPE